MACSEKSPSPAAPSSAAATVDDAGAAADGSTLKVPAPTQTSPANGTNIEQFETTLKVNPVAGLFAPNATQFAYKFQLLLNGQVVREFRTSSFTEWKATDLDINVTYGWRCRAEQATERSARGRRRGPSRRRTSLKATSPAARSTTRCGPARRSATSTARSSSSRDTGAKMVGHGSHIEYALGSTVADGELSMMVTNTPTNTEGDKTKVMSMREGRSDITTNDRRFTAEKRGNPAGIIAWRMITHRDQIDTVGAQRIVVEFSASKWYSLDRALGRQPVQPDDPGEQRQRQGHLQLRQELRGGIRSEPAHGVCRRAGRPRRPQRCYYSGHDRQAGVALEPRPAGFREQIVWSAADCRLPGGRPP